MSEDQGLIQKCMSDLETKLQSNAKLKGKVMHVYSEAELLDKSKNFTNLPAVGIIYEGMRNNSKDGTDSKTPVVSTVIVASIIIITQPDSMLSAQKSETLKFIDQVRDAINKTRSPTSHFWVFQVEAPAEAKANRVLWLQRWSTAAQL